MTKIRLLALLAVVALVLFPALAFAQGGAPQLPCAFYGTVQVNGQNVADGTTVTAKIGNETYPATVDYSASTYRVVISQPENKDYQGLTVTFMIGNADANETATWSFGGNVHQNLTSGSTPITPGGSVINGVQLGNTTGYDPVTGIITINKNAITGPTGATGAAGATGATGPAGKNASSVLGIVATVLAVIAILIGVMVMMRKPQKA